MGNEHKLTKAFEIRPSAIEGADRYELLYVSEERDNVRSRIISRAGTLADVAALGRALVAFAESREPAGLTVGAVFSSHPIVEFFDDGRWWQMTADRRIRWWRTDAIDGQRWSWWQQGATIDGCEHVSCRLVPLATADADPATRGAL